MLPRRIIAIIWLGLCLLTGCADPFTPVQSVSATLPAHLPPANATTRQQLAYMQQAALCTSGDKGCALIEVVAMPGNIPLNRVSVSISVPSGLAGITNDRGWYFPYPAPPGQYQVDMGLYQPGDVPAYESTQPVVLQPGQVAFLRFEVPLEHVPPYYLP